MQGVGVTRYHSFSVLQGMPGGYDGLSQKGNNRENINFFLQCYSEAWDIVCVVYEVSHHLVYNSASK